MTVSVYVFLDLINCLAVDAGFLNTLITTLQQMTFSTYLSESYTSEGLVNDNSLLSPTF